jgi:F-type H+-transporting ATPase subunit b
MEILAQLGIEPAVMLAQAVNFFLLLGILTFLVYKPVLRLLDERKESIRKSAENAQLIEDKLARTEEVTQKEIQKAQKKAQEIIQTAEKLAKEQQTFLVTEAKEKVAKVVEEGRQLIGRERDAAATAIQKEVAKIVILATEKLLGREVNMKDQEHLIAEASKEIASL